MYFNLFIAIYLLRDWFLRIVDAIKKSTTIITWRGCFGRKILKRLFRFRDRNLLNIDHVHSYSNEIVICNRKPCCISVLCISYCYGNVDELWCDWKKWIIGFLQLKKWIICFFKTWNTIKHLKIWMKNIKTWKLHFLINNGCLAFQFIALINKKYVYRSESITNSNRRSSTT